MAATPGTPVYHTIWPLARKRGIRAVEVTAVTDLSGKTVAEIWDRLFQGEELYAEVRRHLRARFPGIKFVDYDTFGDIHGPDERNVVAGIADKLKALGCDAAIVGIGA